MKLKMLPFAALAACALTLSSPLAAQTTVGVINFQQALLATADMQKKAAALETQFKPRQEKLDAIAVELREIQTKLQSATAQAAAQLQADGTRKQREAQRLSEDLQAEIDFERERILQAGAQRMRAVLDALRVEKGMDMLVEAGTVLAVDLSLDLTEAATAAYDAAHPVN